MKNLKKLSRNELKRVGGGNAPVDGGTCHFHYSGTLWGDNMVITGYGSGGCHGGGCYSYYASGSC